jgi:hypothetical protein
LVLWFRVGLRSALNTWMGVAHVEDFQVKGHDA